MKLTNFDTHEGDNEKTAGRSTCCHVASSLLAESSRFQVKEMLDLTEPWRERLASRHCLDVRCPFPATSKEKYNKVIQEEFKSTEDEFVVNQAKPIFVF